MKTPEGKLKEEVKAFLSNLDRCWYFMPVPTGYGVRGIADFIGVWEGRFFSIETKAANGKETPWQKSVREKILASGGLACVVYRIQDVHALFGKT